MLKQKSRAHLAALSPLASVVGSTLSSTPISKQQYKRLVEANDMQIHQNQQQVHATQSHYQQVGGPSHIYSQRRPSVAANQQPTHRCLSMVAVGMQQSRRSANGLFRTDDPVLSRWMQAMRFETELECLTALQARTLAIDEHSAGALSVRNSQVAIQELRLESDLILDLIDRLIDTLPLNFNTIDKFSTDFSELYVKLLEQTRAQSAPSTSATQTTAPKSSHTYCNQLNNLTIINCTPRKFAAASSRTLRPLDKLAVQVRSICIEMANVIQDYQDNYNSFEHIDNGQFEVMLRKIKESYGKFVEISIRAECANIVRALDHNFAASNPLVSGKLSSSSSLRPVRPFESSSARLPLKWALIALWQLTKDDGYICRTLTEKWQTSVTLAPGQDQAQDECANVGQKPRSAKRLDYSTKYDQDHDEKPPGEPQPHPLQSDYEKLYQICQNNEEYQRKQQQLISSGYRSASAVGQENQSSKLASSPSKGALSSALKSKQQAPIKQVSTIELLIDIIISQPNRHERVDMMNFMQNNKLVDLDQDSDQDLDQSISAAFYTSNQYKVAALRILNHLCINEQAVKTILKCFSTPPPKQGHPLPENKIIKSIFECYQTAQEHIYQNETMFNVNRTPRCRKRAKQQHPHHDHLAAEQQEEYSDYGSRQTTNSVPTSGSVGGTAEPSAEDPDNEGDDAVVKEAIRLLVQLTTPFYRSTQGHDYYILIGRFSIESLVKYLTSIVKSTTNHEMLLLSLSALANISFITTEPMKQYGTNRIILEMFRASKIRSKDLELRDQTVTILANTAEKNLLDIVANGGLTFLLASLEICPTRMANYKLLHDEDTDTMHPYGNISDDNRYDTYCLDSRKTRQIDNKPRDRKPIDLSDEFLDDLDCACDNQQTMTSSQLTCLSRLTVGEMAALERIHQKTAVAFARMSVDPSTTRMVFKYGGVKQMIDLCKLSHKRNHSDTVLIACLAALRKMSKVIGRETFKNYNALDLIELEPDRALEIYGHLYASEV